MYDKKKINIIKIFVRILNNNKYYFSYKKLLINSLRY